MPPESPEPPRRVARVESEEVPSGYALTLATIKSMRRFAREAYKDERISQLARVLTQDVAPRDRRGEAEALLAWTQETFRYVALPWHPQGLARVADASWTLFDATARTGECASLAVAFAAMAMSLGLPARFRVLGKNESHPYDFGHVIAVVDVGSTSSPDWVVADPSYREPLGWPFRPGDVSPVRVFQDFDL